MSVALKILLGVDVVLFICLFVYAVIRLSKKTEEVPVVEACALSVSQETVEEIAVSEAVVTEVQEPIIDAVDDDGDDRGPVRRIPFAEKMLFIDKKTQEYYNALHNKFRSMRKINPRISSKGVSYRLGRELVAKITIRGKTMKLHLALDVNKFEQKIYFQKDLSGVKAYAEVPFTVKVKSDRGLKNSLKLIDELMVAKNIEYKTRFLEADSIEDLKAIVNKK